MLMQQAKRTIIQIVSIRALKIKEIQQVLLIWKPNLILKTVRQPLNFIYKVEFKLILKCKIEL